MKKKVTLTLTIILLLTSLAGCGEQTSSSNVTVTPTPTADITKESNTKNHEPINTETKYLSSIVINNDIAYFNMTMDEFIKNYNRMVDNSSEEDLVKSFMKLNTSPVFIETTDGANIYDVTNTQVSTNRSAVKTTISTLENSSKVFSVNFVVPTSSGLNTDISNEFTRAVIALTASSDSISNETFNSMTNELKANGCAYYKGLFMGYYEQQSARIYRIGAITENTYNQIK